MTGSKDPAHQPKVQRQRGNVSCGGDGRTVGRAGGDAGISQLGPLKQNTTLCVASTQRFIFSLSCRLELQDQDVSGVDSF